MRILVTGKGSAFQLESEHEIVFQDVIMDLTNRKKATLLIEAYRPDAVIHMEASPEGSGQEEVFYESITINANVIHAAVEFGVKKIVVFGHGSGFAYGCIKQNIISHLLAVQEQYGLDCAYFDNVKQVVEWVKKLPEV